MTERGYLDSETALMTIRCIYRPDPERQMKALRILLNLKREKGGLESRHETTQPEEERRAVEHAVAMT